MPNDIRLRYDRRKNAIKISKTKTVVVLPLDLCLLYGRRVPKFDFS